MDLATFLDDLVRKGFEVDLVVEDGGDGTITYDVEVWRIGTSKVIGHCRRCRGSAVEAIQTALRQAEDA